MRKFTQLERYPDYEINEDGVVRRISTERIRYPFPVNGLNKIVLNGNTEYIGRLVAETYIPNPNGFSDVRHINGIKSDDRVENLEWAPHSVTQKDSYGMGANAPGGYSPPKPILVVETGDIYPSIRACARDMCLSPSGIRRQLYGRESDYKGYHFKLIF